MNMQKTKPRLNNEIRRSDGFREVRLPINVKNGKVSIGNVKLFVDGESAGEINPYTLKGKTNFTRSDLRPFQPLIDEALTEAKIRALEAKGVKLR